ncbi:hypothetical protein AB1Y20_017225 [Prymnesium parvum]|uniref:Uncharacterized protein n=1 Tax=Prymnesium parvum TaxID=97485 RepID=A0AB34ICI8_PRYPA
MALSEAAKEGVYLRNFLDDLGFKSDAATPLSTDNSAAQRLAYNPEHHERVKHIERRHFYIRDLVEDHVRLTRKHARRRGAPASACLRSIASAADARLLVAQESLRARMGDVSFRRIPRL